MRAALGTDEADELADDLARLEHELAVVPADNDFEGTRTRADLQPAAPTARSGERIPVHPRVLPIVEGVLDPGCLISSLSSIAIEPGETAQPIHADDQVIPLAKPHPPIVCNTHVGADRLHRGERRDPRSSPAAT